MNHSLQVEVRAINGAGPTRATAEVVNRSMGARVGGSAAILGFGLIVGFLFLPVPLVHFFGLIVFLACGVFAFRRFRVRALVRRMVGRCPACGQETTFFASGGHVAARWPLGSQCGACGIGVWMTPAGPRAVGG